VSPHRYRRTKNLESILTNHGTACDAAVDFASWPYFAPDEINAVTRVLESGKVNYWTGEECTLFEQEYAASLGVMHAISIANGTLALELALHSLGIGPGIDVITSCRTFIASASCVVRVGARPIIADVDRNSQNITVETIRAVLTPRTKAIIVVHLAGWPCDMDPILELAREHGLKVIEDCAQAHGATYKQRPVGSMGDIGAFSFCQDKIITTGGEGGLLVTNDDALWKKAWEFKDHGKGYDTVFQGRHEPGFRWLHESFGTNWRMTGMQAAIGRVALRKLPGWVIKRRANAQTLNQAIGDIGAVRTTLPGSAFHHSYYKYYVFVQPKRLASGWSRDRILEEISVRGVPCFAGSCSEIDRERAFAGAGLQHLEHPTARELGETSLMFLVHPTLSDDSMSFAAETIRSVLIQATSRFAQSG
jgi:dTDP-4-amino-4,6-dideoxygalactose transaminase